MVSRRGCEAQPTCARRLGFSISACEEEVSYILCGEDQRRSWGKFSIDFLGKLLQTTEHAASLAETQTNGTKAVNLMKAEAWKPHAHMSRMVISI